MKLSFSPEPVSMGANYTTNGTFGLNMPIIAPQLWKTVQLNQNQVELKIEESRASKIDMVKEVKIAYFSLLLAKDAYSSLLAGYKNAELSAKTVSDKYQQGLVSEYDKLSADVQLKNQIPQVVNGENAVRLATMQVKVLMGVDVNAPIIFEGELSNYEEEMLADYLRLKGDTDISNNSSLKMLEINQSILEKTETINKFGYLPTLGMQLSYGWQSMAETLKSGDQHWYPGSTLALSLTIPIFDGGKKYFKTKQNKASIINLELQKENVTRQLNLSVTNSLNSIATSVEQVTSNKEVIEQAQKAYNISQKRYTIGSGTILEMNSSETALTQARLQYAQSIFDYLDARATLEATLGKSVEQYDTTEKK